MGPFVLLVLFLAQESTYVSAALTEGLYPDGKVLQLIVQQTHLSGFLASSSFIFGLGSWPNNALPLTA